MSDNITVETLNIGELTTLLRSVGMKVSEVTLGDGIEQGVFPFGDCIKTSKGRRFIIYQKLVDNWLVDRANGVINAQKK